MYDYFEVREKELNGIRPTFENYRDLCDYVSARICNDFCKYPIMPIPEGSDSDWLFSDGSPCVSCPMNMLT